MNENLDNQTTLPQPSRAEVIAQDLRDKIVRGELTGGDQLPSWDELELKYRVTRATLNRVFNRLKQDGFVYSDSTRGTFVTNPPPHLCRYALAFYLHPGDPGWNRFWWTVDNQAMVMNQNSGKQFPRFYGLDAHADNESQIRLISDIQRSRLAGIIVVGHREMLSPAVWECTTIPKVGIGSAGFDPHRVTPAVLVDRQSFIDRSMDYLKSRGRNRIAVITTPAEPLQGFSDAATTRGMLQPFHWRLAAGADHPETVRPMVQLLLSLPKNERPDGLIIADDNLVENAVAALMASGVRVPDELELVTHCAWPQPVGGALPMKRLGYDVSHILRKATELIDAQRRGESAPTETLIPAVFDDEI